VNRNRFYDPKLGRFTSKDPNETGMPILAALTMNAEAIGIAFGALDGQALYGDGMNLHAYQQSNPISNTDPTGLSESIDHFTNTVSQYGGWAGGLVAALKPLFEAMEDRNLGLERFAELAALDMIDLALEEYEEQQLQRWDYIRRGHWKLDVVRNQTRYNHAGFSGLPSDFFLYQGASYIIYIAYDKITKKAKYVGVTSQPLKLREYQHKAKNYILRRFMRVHSSKQARSIAQIILEENTNFDNDINELSPPLQSGRLPPRSGQRRW
jgi:hypothetical protein